MEMLRREQYKTGARKEADLRGLDFLTGTLGERIGETIFTLVNEEGAVVVEAGR